MDIRILVFIYFWCFIWYLDFLFHLVRLFSGENWWRVFSTHEIENKQREKEKNITLQILTLANRMPTVQIFKGKCSKVSITVNSIHNFSTTRLEINRNRCILFTNFFFSKFTPPKLISFFTKKLNRSHSLECPCQKDIIQQAKSFPSIQIANNFFAVQLNFFDFSANPININLILFTLEKLFVIQT